MFPFRLSVRQPVGFSLADIAGQSLLTDGLRAAWQALRDDGATEDELLALVSSEGQGALQALYFLLNRLQANGLLRWTAEGQGRRFATLEALTPRFRFHERALQERLRLSRFALMRRDEEGLVMETPLAPVRLRLHDPAAAAVVEALGRNVTLETIKQSAADGRNIEGLLVLVQAAHLLDEGDDEPALRQWEFHDLLFHTRSRIGRHDRPCGGTFRFPDIEPLSAVKEVIGDTIPLPDVTPGPEDGFFDVLHRRRSIREQGSEPLTLRQLSDFLGHTARISRIADATVAGHTYQTANRPYPSGGGCSELEIYPAVNACRDLPRGLYRYDGKDHRLEKIAAPSEPFEKLLRNAAWSSGAPPQILLIIAARFQRVSWKYESIAYSLILKDVGALQQTMYLVATALGLAPCALGLGDADLFAEVAGLDYYCEGVVGEFVMGSRGQIL